MKQEVQWIQRICSNKWSKDTSQMPNKEVLMKTKPLKRDFRKRSIKKNKRKQ